MPCAYQSPATKGASAPAIRHNRNRRLNADLFMFIHMVMYVGSLQNTITTNNIRDSPMVQPGQPREATLPLRVPPLPYGQQPSIIAEVTRSESHAKHFTEAPAMIEVQCHNGRPDMLGNFWARRVRERRACVRAAHRPTKRVRACVFAIQE